MTSRAAPLTKETQKNPNLHHSLLRPPIYWAIEQRKKMDLQGIEPWTTPMLREYYTTKPQARFCSFAKRTAEFTVAQTGDER